MSFGNKIEELKRQVQNKVLEKVIDKMFERGIVLDVNQTFNVTIGKTKVAVHVRGTVRVSPMVQAGKAFPQ